MSGDIIYQLKKRFNEIYSNAEKGAELKFKDFKTSIRNEKVLDQIIKSKEELIKVNNEVKEVLKAEYCNYFSDENWLVNCFIHRFLIYKEDDSNYIFEGVILGNYQSELASLVHDLSEKIEPFTFEDFLNGQEDILFRKFHNRAPNLQFEEFIKIHNWQHHYQYEICEYERLLLQRKFRSQTSKTNFLQEAFTEKALLDKIFSTSISASASKIFEDFKKIKALKGYNFKDIDEENFVDSFFKYKEGLIEYSSLIPRNVLPISKIYQKGESKIPLSKESLIFISIDRYSEWIDKVIKGELSFQDDWIIDYKKLLQNTKKLGLKKASDYINNFELDYINKGFELKEFKQILHEQADSLRHQLNNLSHHQFYTYLEDDESLLNIFKQLCIHGLGFDIEVETLMLSFELKEKTSFIISELFEAYDNHLFTDDKDKEDGTMNWMYMIKTLYLDSDLMKKHSELLNNFMRESLNKGIPFHFMFKNVNEGMSEILDEAFDRLQKVLDNQPQSIKLIYVQDKLRDLRLRELNSKRYGFSTGTYHHYFKEFLEIEAEYLKETKHINFKNVLPISPAPKLLLSNNNNKGFGYKYDSNLDLSKLYSFLNLHIDFIDQNRTNCNDFVEIMSSYNLSSIKKSIYLNCETVQFRYILDKLKPFFNNFNPSSVENSCLFYSKNGTLLKASNLYKNKIPNPKKQDIIDSYFKNLLK